MTPGADRKHPCNHPGLDLHDPGVLEAFDEGCNTGLENAGTHLDRDAVLELKANFWDALHSKIYGMTDDRCNPYRSPDHDPSTKARVMAAMEVFNEWEAIPGVTELREQWEEEQRRSQKSDPTQSSE